MAIYKRMFKISTSAKKNEKQTIFASLSPPPPPQPIIEYVLSAFL